MNAIKKEHAQRLCLVTETWPPEINGVAMTLSRLVDGLLSREWKVTLVRPKQRNEVVESNPHLTHHVMPGLPIPGYAGLRFGLPVIQQLYKAWEMDRPDVVHVATEGPLGWAAMRVANKLKIPVTTTFHTNFHRYCKHYRVGWLGGVVARYLRVLHNRSFCTMVPNQMLKQILLEEGYANVEVLGRGVDNELFTPSRRNDNLRKQWGLSDNDIAVIYVGRLAPEKNLDLVVEAYSEMHKQNPKLKMIWVGEGPQYNRLRKNHPHHFFMGSKVGKELAECYASADVFLFPSMTETYGNVVAEAMASGLAVIAYDYAAAAIHMRHEENGLLVSFGDSDSFVKNAKILSNQFDLVKTLGNHAHLTLKSSSWKDVSDVFERNLLAAISQAESLHVNATEYSSSLS